MNTMSNQRAIITIIVIIGVTAFGYWFLQKPATPNETTPSPGATTTGGTITPPTPTPPNPTPAAAPKGTTKTTTTTKVATPTMTKDGLYIVSYTNKGFVPASLQIKRGRGVHFVNNSDKALRIFSDQKDDQVYGQLNQGKTVGKGGTYDFTFNTSGNWGYHNANNSLDHGIIIVDQN